MNEETVVSIIDGGAIKAGEPNENCIETLEELLADAKIGEIVGISAACVHQDGASSFKYGGCVKKHGMLGALSRLTYFINKLIDQD